MEDKRGRREASDLQRIVDAAIREVVNRLPQEQQAVARRELRAQIARVLTETPLPPGEAGGVAGLALRARLAAVFERAFDSSEDVRKR